MLARWITSPRNPLFARVVANRIWQHHFGRGIVRTPNDFGLRGARPTHPELLDWLASDLEAGGWRLKRLHRLILLSSAYRMASTWREEAHRRDPENDILWRFEPRRLEAEEIRDSILATSGELELSAGGPGVYPLLPAEVLHGQSRSDSGWGNSSERERSRRSIYIHQKRSLIPPMIATFDSADTDSSCPVRFSTTQPTQALTLLNSAFLARQAAAFAERLRREAGGAAREQVLLALRLVTGRQPEEEEVREGTALIAGLQEEPGVGRERALERRGLLDETLIPWGGEFGRQPTAEYAKGTGRDHNAYGFTTWLAGGGIRGGTSVGETDELGSAAVRDRLHVRRVHATVLHQLGLDPNGLTYFHAGLDPNGLTYFHAGLDPKLVGVEGAEPIEEIIA